MEAADFKARVELGADGSVVEVVLTALVNLRKPVAVVVELVKSDKVVLENRSARKKLDHIARAPGVVGEIVGNTVVVDIAEVILAEVFARKNGLDFGLEIVAVRSLLVRESDAAGSYDARYFRAERIAEDAAFALAVLSRGMKNPAVEERILDVVVKNVCTGKRIAVERTIHIRLVEAILGNRNILTVVETAVVERSGDLIAERENIGECSRAAVPGKPEILGARERYVLGKRMTRANSLQGGVLAGERRGRETSAWTVRRSHEELRRRDLVLVYEFLVSAVLVLDEDHDVDRALHIAEIRDERIARRLGYVNFLGVVAAGDGNFDAGRNAVFPESGEIVVDVVLDAPCDFVGFGLAARDGNAVRIRFGLNFAYGRDVIDQNVALGALVVFVRGLFARSEYHILDDRRFEFESVDGGILRTVHALYRDGNRRGSLYRDVVDVVFSGNRRLERAVELKITVIGLAGLTFRNFEPDGKFARIARIPVAQSDLNPAASHILVVNLLGDDSDAGIVENSNSDRICSLGVVAHILVHNLEGHSPVTSLREGIGENLRCGIAFDLSGIIISHALKACRPSVFEGLRLVDEVILAGLVDDEFELGISLFRDLVLVDGSVGPRLEAVHLNALDHGLNVENPDVKRLRVITGDFLRRIGLAVRKHDFERKRKAARRLHTFDKLDAAQRRLDVVLADRNTDRIFHADDGCVRTRRLEHIGRDVRARLQERVNGISRIVLLAERNLEIRLFTFVVNGLRIAGKRVIRLKRRSARLLDVRKNVPRLALLAAYGRNDVELALDLLAGNGVVEYRTLVRLVEAAGAVVRKPEEFIAFSDIVDSVERLKLVRLTIAVENFVADRRIGHIRIRVADRDGEFHIVAADSCDRGGLDGNRDNGILGDKLHARVLVILKERLRVGVIDRGLEHDARCTCCERIASQTENVNLLLGRGTCRNRDDGNFIVRKSRNLGLRFGETDIFADVLRCDAVDGRGDFNDHILIIGFREIDAHYGAVYHIVSVGVRDGTVRLDGNRRWQRIKTLDGDLDIVGDAGARRFGVVVVLPGAHDELAGLAGAARDAFNLKINRGNLSA